jgi:predicted secreted protein
MIKHFLFFTFFVLSSVAMASVPIAVSPLGVSPKGQFVALEEVGVHQDDSHYVKIRIFNTWKKEFIGDAITVNNAKEDLNLNQLKNKARSLARLQFKQFNINV